MCEGRGDCGWEVGGWGWGVGLRVKVCGLNGLLLVGDNWAIERFDD